MDKRVWLRMAEAAALLLVLSLAATLRLANRADNPGWYSDEGTHIDIAMNLMEGRAQSLALTQSTLIVARPPLFHLLLAGVFRAWGPGIATLRGLTGVLGVLSVCLLYLVTRKAHGPALALLAAFTLTIYPDAVLYSRLGFSYNLLAPLVLLACLGLWLYLENTSRAWLALAAAAIGVGAISDVMILSFALPFSIVVSARRWRDLSWSLPLLAAPFGLYIAVMLAVAPQAFLFDLRFIFFSLGTIPLIAQLPFAVANLALLLARDYWLAPAIAGLFVLKPRRWGRLNLLLLLLPLFSLARTTTGLSGLSFYYLIPLLPFVALGVASLIRYGAPHVLQTLRDGLADLFQQWGWSKGRWTQARLLAAIPALGLFLIIVGPLIASTFLTAAQVQTGFKTTIEAALIDPASARLTAEFINHNTGPDDVVIASPAVAWLFKTHTADFQQALAADGEVTMSFPAGIPADRFAFDARYTQARFVVVDRIWRNWGAPNMPGVADLMHEAETWPLAFQAGEFYVYQNPAK